MNVFSELVHSVYDCKSYGSFLKDKKRKTFLFGFLLVLIYYLVTIILPFVRFQVSTGGIMSLVDDVLPEFTISDNKLWVDSEFELDESGVYVYVNTNGQGLSEDEIRSHLRRDDTVLIANADSVVIKENGRIQYVELSDLDPDLEITKTGLINMFGPFVTIGIAVVLVIIFICMQAGFFFGVLFIGLFGMIVASCMHSKLTFGQLYKLGIYSRTTPLLIKAVFSFLPVGIPFYFIISTGISLMYLAGAIRRMEEPDLEGRPVVFYSDGAMANDRWSRPEQDGDRWNRPENDEDRWNHSGDS